MGKLFDRVVLTLGEHLYSWVSGKAYFNDENPVQLAAGFQEWTYDKGPFTFLYNGADNLYDTELQIQGHAVFHGHSSDSLFCVNLLGHEVSEDTKAYWLCASCEEPTDDDYSARCLICGAAICHRCEIDYATCTECRMKLSSETGTIEAAFLLGLCIIAFLVLLILAVNYG